ncbi:MAG: thioesterase family protein [Lachnospiraceae bacterium]|nr:thioesterase family protein [Lachnospiraceae bacterium]
MRKDCIFFCEIRVRYGEVDQQGIVYNGNYVAYTDLAFEEYLRFKGYSYGELSTKYNSEVCHKKSTYEFHASAFEGDMLEVGLRVLKIGTKSFTLGFEVYRQGEDQILVSAESVYVGYDPVNRASLPITPLLRSILGESGEEV